jgi:hypothetical protein
MDRLKGTKIEPDGVLHGKHEALALDLSGRERAVTSFRVKRLLREGAKQTRARISIVDRAVSRRISRSPGTELCGATRSGGNLYLPWRLSLHRREKLSGLRC